MHSIHKKLKYHLFFALIPAILLEIRAQTPWDTDPRAYVQSKAVQASFDQNQIQDSLKQEKNKQIVIENKLSRTVQSSSSVNSLKAELRQSKLTTKGLQTKLTEKIMEGKAYKEMMGLSDQEIRQKLKDFPFPGNQTDTSAIAVHVPSPQQPPAHKPKSEMLPSGEKLPSQTFDPWAGLSATTLSTALPCQFQETSAGGNRKAMAALQSEVLFNHTPEEIKKYLNGQHYVTGEAFIATEPGYTYLQLKLSVASDQALKHYGNLEKSIMAIHFVNGKELKLVNTRYDAGSVDQVHKTTSMTGMYFLEKSMIKMMMSSEVDHIRLNFTTGYEDYVVYNIDFFTRQLACINASK